MYDVYIMHRTQILLDPRQHAALKAWSAAEGCSLAALLRRLVDEALARRKEPGTWAGWVRELGPTIEGRPVPEAEHDEAVYGEDWE
jgi:hypothetical protein